MGALILTYNGADVPDACVTSLVTTTHSWGRIDWTELTVADPDGRWAAWQPRRGDVLRARLGDADTGAMHVTRVRRCGGSVSMRALSAPARLLEPRWRSWDAVRLHQLLAQVAGECGLVWESYGVDDRLYGQVEQRGTGDIRFLARRLAMEGASVIVCGNRLAAVSGEWMQNQEREAVSVPASCRVELTEPSRPQWGSCRVRAGVIRGSFAQGDGPTMDVELESRPTSIAEADRWARGLLWSANRDAATATVRGFPGAMWLCAGTAVDLAVEVDPSWSGRYVASRVQHDLVAETTTATFSRFSNY